MLYAALGVVSLAVIAVTGYSDRGLVALAALFGGVSFTLYPLAVAHANDYIEPADLVPASGGLLLAYSIGSAIDPLGASGLMSQLGAAGLFAFTGAIGLVSIGFALWRIRSRSPLPGEEQGPFVALPRTGPVASELDPRGEPEQRSFDFAAPAPAENGSGDGG